MQHTKSELTLPLVQPGVGHLDTRLPRSDSAPPSLSLRNRAALALQKAIGRLTVFVYAPLIVFLLRWVMGYRFRDIETVRRQFLEIREHHPGPLLLCPNHLTMIDSAIVAWGLASPLRYAVRYRLLPWNLPEQTNFASPIVRALCYLAKCLPIRRGGARGPQQAVFAKCARLLGEGHPVLVFPEGRRSRTGAIDPSAMAHGVGRLVRSVPNCAVLCVYLRGDHQTRHSSVPRRGECFSMDLKLIHPQSSSRGVRASREITLAILAELGAMEQAYHARRQ
jgi:1-acyl-sn-glycerol-3-phosphate acyltransferase